MGSFFFVLIPSGFSPIDSGDLLNINAAGAINKSIPTPTQIEATSQPHFSTTTESKGTIKAPPNLNAALLIDIAIPLFFTNHILIAVVEACMKLVEPPNVIAKIYIIKNDENVSVRESRMYPKPAKRVPINIIGRTPNRSINQPVIGPRSPFSARANAKGRAAWV